MLCHIISSMDILILYNSRLFIKITVKVVIYKDEWAFDAIFLFMLYARCINFAFKWFFYQLSPHKGVLCTFNLFIFTVFITQVDM